MSGGQLSSFVRAGFDALKALPIELRTDEFALVERTTVGKLAQSIKACAPGHYSVGVTLPSGTRLSQSITVNEGGGIDLDALVHQFLGNPTVNAFVRRHAARALPFNPSKLASGILDYVSSRTPLIEDHGPGSVVLVRAFEVVQGRFSVAAPSTLLVRREVGSAKVTVSEDRESHGGSVLLQVLREDFPALNIMLPGGATLTLTVPDEAEEAPATVSGMELGIDLIDDMLRLRLAGRIDEFVALVSGLSQAEIDHHVIEFPGACFAAAYAILRSTDRSLAVKAVRALEARRPGWPDTLILASELAAIEGNHAAAVTGFASVCQTGLPLFSYGLNYVIDRLRLYVQSAASKKVSAVDGAVEAARGALKWAQRVGVVTDFDQPLLTFNGLDPENPDNRPVNAIDVRAAGGMAVLSIRRNDPDQSATTAPP